MTNSLINLRHSSHSPEATQELGYRLAQELLRAQHFPVVVLLSGELGAGKTVFSQGVAWGLGIEELVPSPTFPILLEYPGPVPLYHFDLYRLGDSEEFDLIGGEDLLFNGGSYGPGLSLLEWSERWLGRVALPCLRVNFYISPQGREITIQQLGSQIEGGGP